MAEKQSVSPQDDYCAAVFLRQCKNVTDVSRMPHCRCKLFSFAAWCTKAEPQFPDPAMEQTRDGT
jgi:hypothetical protein